MPCSAGQGELMPMPRLEVVRDLDDDARQLPGHHRRVLRDPGWESRPVVVGTPDRQASGVFVKLDPEQVIEDERARLGDTAPGGTRHHTDPLAAPKMAPPKRVEGTDEAPTA